MSRKRSRKVLYEVSSEVKKARKSRPRLEISKRARAFTKNITSGRAIDIKEKAVIKPVGFKRNLIVLAGRLLNFSVKKAIIVLVIFAAIVIFWPDGEKPVSVDPDPGSDAGISEISGMPVRTVETPETETVTETPQPSETEVESTEIPGPPKDHWIVIASHTEVDQLKALSGHFALNGIKTEIKLGSSRHTLITKDRYLKPGDPQSGIKQAKAKIQAVGNKYKPQRGSGYLRFEFKGIYEQKVR